MSLLDTASLLLTPNAYKEGKLYSVIPSNGNGDFTATRATTATRINAAGLVDLVPYNLFTWSEMFTNIIWNKQNATISANVTTAPDGTLTADKLVADATLGQHRIFEIGPSLDSGTYTFSVYAKAGEYGYLSLGSSGGISGGNIIFNLLNGTISGTAGNITTSIQSVGNGWYRCIFSQISVSPSLSWWIVARNANNTSDYTGNGSDGLFIWGAQLVQGTSERDYLRTETRLNIPRVDYSLGGCPNILLEPQRTNLALQSSSFDSATWLKTSTSVTANSSISPSGITDADTINITTSSGFIRQTGNIASATSYTYSVYVKKSANTANNLFRLYYNNNVASPNNGEFRAVVDLTNLTITTTSLGTVTTGRPTIISSNLTDVGNGWYRASVAFTTGTSAGNASAEIGLQANTTAVEFLAWGAQLEVGSYGTSFIPTTTASVTRNLDNITRTNVFTNGWITAAGGTWFVEIRGNVPVVRDLSTSGIFLNTGVASTIGNGLVLRNAGSSASRMAIFTVVAGGLSSNLYTIPTDNAKVAFKWNGTTADVFVNGVKVVNATPFTSTAMQNLIGEGNNRAVYINEMTLFPTPLTDTQCIDLTT